MTEAECDELRRQFYNATVVYLKKVHSDLMIVRVRPDFPVPSHKPGQYCTLGLGHWEPRVPGCQEEVDNPADVGKLVRRAYSIGLSILDENGRLFDFDTAHAPWLELYIVLVRGAEEGSPALTPRLFTLQTGRRVFLGTKITGHFTLDPVQPNDTVVFLSTGTGEAPHNYMLWDLLRRGHPGRILAACCVRHRTDLGYLTVHEELMRRHANYTYLPLTTRDADTVGHKVYIQDLITSGLLEKTLGRPLDSHTTHVYLCGNPKMIGAPVVDRATGAKTFPQPPGVVELLTQRQFQIDQPRKKIVGNIHFEEYW